MDIQTDTERLGESSRMKRGTAWMGDEDALTDRQDW